MPKFFPILLLLLTPILAFAAEPAKPKQEFTQEHMDQMKAAEEKYKDNPAVLKIIENLKKGMGMTDEPEQVKGPPPPPKHISTVPASRAGADAAYSKKDYAKALEQYKSLAAAGDPEANAIVGMMYEGGIGTEPDPVTAQAWYERAAESGPDDNRFSKMVTGKTVESYEDSRMSGGDAARAGELRKEIDREISELGTATQQDNQSVPATTPGKKGEIYSYYPASSGNSDMVRYTYMPEPRDVKIVLKKIEQPDYLRPQIHTEPGHFQPGKFTRQPLTSSVSDS